MSRVEITVITLLVLVLTVPFLNKPFHIDDTVVLQVTQNILESFWDPFSGTIDWFGYELELWKATTNPPFLSYFLAPFALLSDYSETVLHLAMLVFYLMLAFSMHSLARRFVSPDYWPLLFLMTSVSVLVSGNVMRDVPGTALGLAGVACFIWGSDQNLNRWLLLGALLAGMAVLTKYSAAVVLPLMGLYAYYRGKPRQILWLAASGSLLAGWCLHNWLIHGQVHMIYLLLERRSTGSIFWHNKLFAALTVLGSSSLLFISLLLESVRRRRWLVLSSSLFLALIAICCINAFHESPLGPEYLLWAVAGVLTFSIPVLAASFQSDFNRDSLFLVVWCGGVVLFSVFMVPFQAVRHLLPALPPLIILSFRFLGASGVPRSWKEPNILVYLLLIQLGIAGVVHSADYEYAASYRKFAGSARERDVPVWYVGHWGWKFYADRSGFRQLHRDGPFPRKGDFLLWPQKVHIGRVFQNDRGLRDRLELVSSDVYKGIIPVRTMDRDAGAGFYSVGRGQVPYSFFPEGPVEVMRIYRVAEDYWPSP